jgi:hypothetical protein
MQELHVELWRLIRSAGYNALAFPGPASTATNRLRQPLRDGWRVGSSPATCSGNWSSAPLAASKAQRRLGKLPHDSNSCGPRWKQALEA